MRDRRLILLLLAAAVHLGGCSAMMQANRLREPPLAGMAAPQAEAELNRAVALAADLKYDQAAAILQDLLPRLEPTAGSTPDGQRDLLADTMFWLGFCREKQGRTAQAVEHYNRVLRERPQAPAARQAAERLQRLSPR